MDISQVESFSVVNRVDDNLLEHFQALKQGSSLKISLKPTRDGIIGDANIEAQVTMSELVNLDLSGSSYSQKHRLALGIDNPRG